MTAPPTTLPPAAAPAPDEDPRTRHRATPAQLAWLETQLRAWHAEGLVDDTALAAICARYVAHRRVTLARIVLTLGAAFVGLGLVWLVASNLDSLPPLLRFGLVASLWLGLVAAAEALARRRERRGDVASPVVGAARLLAAAAFGAVVFQAAQSLQVPAYEPLLVGVWALGALLSAYAAAAVGPAVLGIGLGVIWLVWHVVDASEDVLDVAATVGGAALLAVAVGALHERLTGAGYPWRGLGVPWREAGALLALGGLFGAALPFDDDVSGGSVLVWVVVALAVLLAGYAALTGDRLDRLEVGLAALALAATVLLAVWRTSSGLTDTSDLAAGDWARAVVAVVLYLGVASGYAVLGGMRDADRLTWLATGALVLFTTVQAFAVFAPILSGAVLFLAVGLVLLGTGVVADRGRRRLVREGREVAS